MCITDAEWVEILKRSRIGECTEDDLKEMKKLVLTNAKCEVPNFTSAPWNEAILVTPHHGICTYWNTASLRKHCALTGNTLYSCDTEDSYGQDQQPLQECLKNTLGSCLASWSSRLA